MEAQPKEQATPLEEADPLDDEGRESPAYPPKAAAKAPFQRPPVKAKEAVKKEAPKFF